MKIRAWLALTGVAVLAVTMSQAQNVVTDWTKIAANTVLHGNKGGDAFLYFAYASIAVYDGTNSIDRRFRPFYFAERTDRDASDEAAAISAAHTVLVYYFPDQEAIGCAI